MQTPNAPIIVLPSTYYYRWSTTGQIKKLVTRNNETVLEEKERVIKETVDKCVTAIQTYRGFCSVCNKEIRLMFAGGNGYLDKGETGRKTEREEIDSLMEDAKQGKFQAVITPISSRLGRRVSVSQTLRDRLKDLGIQVLSLHQPVSLKCPDCYDPLDDDSAVMTETMSDMQAQLELASIRRNYKNGMPVRIKSGKPSGSLGYGLIKKYKIVGHDPRGNDALEEFFEWDNDKLDVVKRIVSEFMNGAGTWGISQRLNQDGIPSPQGKKWGRSAILVILKNPIYAGYNRFYWKVSKRGKRIIQDRSKWLLEKSLLAGPWDLNYYDKIQEEIKRRHQLGGRAVSSTALLIGMAKCGYCHYSMYQSKTDRERKDGSLYKYRGYACGHFLHFGACKHNGVNQKVLDAKVLNEINKLFNDRTRDAFLEKLRKTKTVDLNKLIRDKKDYLYKLTKELERAEIAYRAGIDDLSKYAENKRYYEPLIEGLQKDLSILQNNLQNTANVLTDDESYGLAIKKFLEYPTDEDKQKVRNILFKIIDKIEFTQDPCSIKIFYKLF